MKKGYRPRVGKSLLVPAYVSSDYLASKKAGAGRKVYKVRRGDTLAKLAARFGVSQAELKQANKLPTDILPAGKRLIIPVAAATTAAQPSNDSSKSAAAVSPKPVAYRVKRGDSLWDIAKRFGVSVKEIMDFNKLSSHILAVGMVIRIPV
jgi:LysM repeat protein